MWFLFGFLLGALAAWLAVYLWYEWHSVAIDAEIRRLDHMQETTMRMYQDAIKKLIRIREIVEE